MLGTAGMAKIRKSLALISGSSGPNPGVIKAPNLNGKISKTQRQNPALVMTGKSLLIYKIRISQGST